MLIYCTLQMHVQQATYANELHVNVQHHHFFKRGIQVVQLPFKRHVQFQPLHILNRRFVKGLLV